MARICGKCKGSGWWGSRFDLGPGKNRGGPCRMCNGTGYDNRWAEKYCLNCSNTIEYRLDRSNVPNYCQNCRRDQYKTCANPHCGGTVHYKIFWDKIPDYCQQCKGWFEKQCLTSGCTEKVRIHCEWTHQPGYCQTCKKLGGRNRDPWMDPRNRIERWTDVEGRVHEKIVQGPDTNAHRGYDPNKQREFEAGKDYERRKR